MKERLDLDKGMGMERSACQVGRSKCTGCGWAVEVDLFSGAQGSYKKVLKSEGSRRLNPRIMNLGSEMGVVVIESFFKRDDVWKTVLHVYLVI